MRTLLLESVAGVAGDMFTAAFLDAGLIDAESVRAVPAALGLEGVEVLISERTTASIRTTHLDVDPGEADGHHHSYRDIDGRLEASALSPAARDFARGVFRHLAEAEAAAHGVTLDRVHFHEVGAVDSVVDVAMAGLCATAVDADEVLATPVRLGRGSIEIEHGTHAVPPPASARLAEGFPVRPVPPAITRPDVELSTPTGLAILKTLSPTFVEEWPAGTLVAQGMGSGTMEFESYPNVFRVALFEAAEGEQDATSDFVRGRVMEVCFNIDDESGERLAWIAERLREGGALDVWTTPIVGKKGRPAVQMSFLAAPDRWAELARWTLRETSTFGLRYRPWERLELERSFEVRDIDGREVTYKIGRTTAGEVVKEKPEYEDLKHLWNRGSP